ncbi:MAG: hypothetical protein ACI849_001820, partial [Patiriisocius sp.]
MTITKKSWTKNGRYIRVFVQKKHEGASICEFVGVASGINLGILFDFQNGCITGASFCECFGGVEAV